MTHTLRRYPRNSPRALARVVFMMMITDGDLGELELAALERLRVFSLLGIDRAGFAAVARDYCSDLLDCADAQGRVRLVEVARIDAILDEVDDPRRRLLVCALMLNLAAAQSRLHAVELELLRYVFVRWNLSPDTLGAALAAEAQRSEPVGAAA